MTGKIMPLRERDTSMIQPRPAPSCPRHGTPTRIPAAATPTCPAGCSPGSAPAARWPRSAGRNWPGCWSSCGAARPGRPGTATAAPWPPGCRGAPPAGCPPGSCGQRRTAPRTPQRHPRGAPGPAIDRALSRRDVPLGEMTLRRRYETAARASEVLTLNIEDLGLNARRAPVRSTGGDTGWICRGSGTAHLLPRLIRAARPGRGSCPGAAPARRPPRSEGPVPGHPRRARVGGDRARVLLTRRPRWRLRQLRHLADARLGEQGIPCS